MCTAALLISSCAREDEGGALQKAAAFTHSCVDLVCEFDGSSSTEVPGEVGSWHWSFGDGTFSTSRNPSHAYSEGGEFDVTLTVTEPGGGSAVHLEQLTIEEPEQADPGHAVVELSYGATEAGQYVTNWTHHTPGLSLTIGDGWGVADTLTAVEVGPLDKWGNRTCNPLARIVVLQGTYDPVQESMVPFNDLTDTLLEDGRINVISVTPTEVGGFSATRIDGTLNRDGLDLSWRFCRAGVRTFAFGTSDLDDPAYKWVWLPALSNLSFWVVHVESSDVLISLTHQDSDERLLEEIEAIIASLEFHPPREPVATRTLNSEFGDIEIFNGTARLHSLVEWSVGRFSGSGLGSPGVSRVTFSADVECHERGYAGGFTETSQTGSQVKLCFGEGRPESAARLTLLHEFAHAWLEAHGDQEARSEFLAELDLAAWYPSKPGPPEAGVEYAADVIAWGLLGESDLSRRLADRTCDTLGDAFRLLTGAEPPTDPALCNR